MQLDSLVPSVRSPAAFVDHPLVYSPANVIVKPPIKCAFVPHYDPSILSVTAILAMFSPVYYYASAVEVLPFNLLVSGTSYVLNGAVSTSMISGCASAANPVA